MKEANERSRLWHAMSKVYLDEEMTLVDYLHVANELASSNLSTADLETIFFTEVHPVLCWNLQAVAGHWGDFGREWVAEQIEEHLKVKPKKGWLEQMRARRRNRDVEELRDAVQCTWEKIKLLIEVIRHRGIA